jgi:hypothetical protein
MILPPIAPRNPNIVNSFLNLRVADIWACYKQWKAKGAHFLTEPLDNHGHELRCYLRDPDLSRASRDAYILEVGQYSPVAIAAFARFAS